MNTSKRSSLCRTLLATGLVSLLIPMGGCQPSSVSVSCSGGGSSASCRITVTWTFNKAMSAMNGGGEFDADSANIDLSASDVAVNSVGNNVTLGAMVGGTNVGQLSTPVSFSGSTIYFADPGAVNAWVASHPGNSVDFSLQLNQIAVVPHSGQNTLAAELEYEGGVVGAGSHSWQDNGGGGGPPTHLK